MKTILFLVFMISTSSLIAVADDVEFKPNDKQDPKAIQVGAIRTMPAGKGVDGTYLLKLGSAKSWNEARNMCVNLSPIGKWDLPQSITSSAIAQAMDKSYGFRVSSSGKDNSKAYLMWTRADSEEENKKLFDEKAIALAIIDGEDDEFGVDVKALKAVDRDKPMPGTLMATLQGRLIVGLAVYCEYQPQQAAEENKGQGQGAAKSVAGAGK